MKQVDKLLMKVGAGRKYFIMAYIEYNPEQKTYECEWQAWDGKNTVCGDFTGKTQSEIDQGLKAVVGQFDAVEAIHVVRMEYDEADWIGWEDSI